MIIIRIIIIAVIVFLTIVIAYNLYALLKELWHSLPNKEDKQYKVEKFIHEAAMIVLGTIRSFLLMAQSRKREINPSSLFSASACELAMKNLQKIDPAISVKEKIDREINQAMIAIEKAQQNAQKHNSAEALAYVGECRQQILAIYNNEKWDRSISATLQVIGEITKQMQIIADAPTFDDAQINAGQTAALNFYEVLKVAKTASFEEIRKAYKKLAQEYHPDKYEHLAADMKKQAEQRFTQINIAYQTLSDPQKRKDYDATLS